MRTGLICAAILAAILTVVITTAEASPPYEGSSALLGDYTGTKTTPPPASAISFTAYTFGNQASVRWHDGSRWIYKTDLQGYEQISASPGYPGVFKHVVVFHGGPESGDYQVWRHSESTGWQLVEQGNYNRTSIYPS